MLSEKKRRGTRCNSVPRLFMFRISSGSLRYSCSCRSNYLVAIASISSITSFGRRATSTQLLAGYAPSKNVAYTSLIAAKSFISLINTVVFTTFAMLVSAASSRFAGVPLLDGRRPAFRQDHVQAERRQDQPAHRLGGRFGGADGGPRFAG